MAVATGVSMNARYILPFTPHGKNISSIKYQSELSLKAQNKLKAYELYKLGKLTMQDIADIFEVDKGTVSRWINQAKIAKSIRRYQYLEPKSTAPHRKVRKKKIDFNLKDKILDIRDKRKCGKEKIAKYLKDEFDIKIHPSTIQRFINSLNPIDDPKFQNRNVIKFKKRYKNLTRLKDVFDKLTHRAFERFQVDTKYWVINGRTFYIVTAIDVVTRMMFAYAYTRHTAICARDFLTKLNYLFNLEGSKAYLQRDNGSEFMAEFEEQADRFGITSITNYVRIPKMNGYVERLNRTIKEECLLYNIPDTVVEANKYLGEYILDYNFERIHSGINDNTPFEKFCDITFKGNQCSDNTRIPLLQMYRAFTKF